MTNLPQISLEKPRTMENSQTICTDPARRQNYAELRKVHLSLLTRGVSKRTA
jgi:hypothetical protein